MPANPSSSAIEEFARKAEVPSWARTADWDTVPAMLRRRAFWSAGLEAARALGEERQAVADLLRGASKGGKLYRRDTAVRELKAMMEARGLDTGEPGALTNPASEARIRLVLDTNRAQARNYARFKRSSTGGALRAFPAQELVRVRASKEERPWRVRWQGNGGRLWGGRMIALKSDPVWTAISRFGTPYPPFDFNSGMGVRDVSRREAVALGVIGPDYVAESDPVGDFNATAEADVSKVPQGLLARLAEVFGDAVAIADGVARIVS